MLLLSEISPSQKLVSQGSPPCSPHSGFDIVVNACMKFQCQFCTSAKSELPVVEDDELPTHPCPSPPFPFLFCPSLSIGSCGVFAWLLMMVHSLPSQAKCRACNEGKTKTMVSRRHAPSPPDNFSSPLPPLFLHVELASEAEQSLFQWFCTMGWQRSTRITSLTSAPGNIGKGFERIETCLVGEDWNNTILDLFKMHFLLRSHCSGAVALGLSGGIQACPFVRHERWRNPTQALFLHVFV